MGNEVTDLEGTNASMHHLTSGDNLAASVRKESPVLQDEPQLKRIKIEALAGPALALPASLGATALPQSVAASGVVAKNGPSNQMLAASGHFKQNLVGEKVGGGIAVKKEAGTSGNSIVTVSPMTNQSTSDSDNSSATSLHEDAHKNLEKPRAVEAPLVQAPAAAAAAGNEVPLKSTTMFHLQTKYTGELDYMLREFRKLERQLLGAKGASQLEESAGSRERREKLHAFILHLEDTLRQIELGCKLEAEGKTTVNVGVTTSNNNTNAAAAAADEAKKQQLAEQAALTNLTQEKEEEENVQKLEEHILANLLPVKVRLKKQLAAQQGATKNPVGMPASRRGMLQPSATAELGKGTFAAAAEQRRKQAEEARRAAQDQEHAASRVVTDPTQFGKPLRGGGSSLTQKLHGATLGSKARINGHGVGFSTKLPAAEGPERPERKILYAGMVPQSLQHSSGVAAASGVHEMVIEDPTLRLKSSPGRKQEVLAASSAVQLSKPMQAAPQQPTAPSKPAAPSEDGDDSDIDKKPDASELTEEEIRKLRKRRRKKKLLRLGRQREKERRRQIALHQQAVQAAQTSSAVVPGRKKGAGGKGQGKKKGPRSVEYICALCSEAYSSTCDYNPWWALAHHECPKCRKNQVPRIDISSPANAIEYHPALLAHADDNGGGNTEETPVVHVSQPQALPAVVFPPKSTITPTKYPALSASDSDSESDLSDLSDGSLSDYSMDSDDSSLDLQSMSPAEQAEHETFGHDYKGPVFSDENASRLLILMCHASTCPCKHKLTKTRDACKSTKYMMLHVRDCPGTTSSFDVCPFPWCRKVKHLLYHLVSCTNPKECTICSPKDLTKGLKGLVGLNEHRFKEKRERLVAAMKAASEAARGKGPGSLHPTVVVSASLTPMPAPTQKAPTKHKIVQTSTHNVPPAPTQHLPTSLAKPIIPQPATMKASFVPSTQPVTQRAPHSLASATTAAVAQPTQIATGIATIVSQPVKSQAQALSSTTPNNANTVPHNAHAAQTAAQAKVATTRVLLSKTEAVAVSASLVVSSQDRPQPMDERTMTANASVPNPIPQPSTPPTSNTSQGHEQRLSEVTTGQHAATATTGAPPQVTAQAPQEAVQVKEVNDLTPNNPLDAAAQHTGGARCNAPVESTAMDMVNVSEAREEPSLPSEPALFENAPTAQELMAESNATKHLAVMKEELVVMSTGAAPLGVEAMDLEAAAENNEVAVPNPPLVNVPTVSLEPTKSDGVVQGMPQPIAQEIASPVKASADDLPTVGKDPAPTTEVFQMEQAPNSQMKLEALQIDTAASQVSVPLQSVTPPVVEEIAFPAVATAAIAVEQGPQASSISNPLENCTTPGLDSVAVKQGVLEGVFGKGNSTEQPNIAVVKTTAIDDQMSCRLPVPQSMSKEKSNVRTVENPLKQETSTATENAAAEETVVALSSDQPQDTPQKANPEEPESALQADTTVLISRPPAVEQVKEEPVLAEETEVAPFSDQAQGPLQEANPDEPESVLQADTTAVRSPPPNVEQVKQEPALDEGANPARDVASGELQAESWPSTSRATEEDATSDVKNGSSDHSTSAAGDSGADDRNGIHSLGANSGNGNHHTGKPEKSADVVEVGC